MKSLLVVLSLVFLGGCTVQPYYGPGGGLYVGPAPIVVAPAPVYYPPAPMYRPVYRPYYGYPGYRGHRRW